MPGLSQEQLVKMVDDTATIRTLVGTHNDRLKGVEDSVKSLDEKLDGHVEWRNSVNTRLDELKTGVEECKKSGGIFAGLDRKTLIKMVALIVAALVAGGAGSEAVMKLVAMVLGSN